MKYAPVTCVIFSLSLSAGTLSAAQPDAGTLLQHLEVPVLPDTRKPVPALTQPSSEVLQDETPIRIRGVNLIGNSMFSDAQLLEPLSELFLPEMTLTELQHLCNLIGDFYRGQGYPLVHAVIPAQEISDGIITIQVVEARLGEMLLSNNSEVSSGLIGSILAKIPQGEVIQQSELDRALLLLADLPGTDVFATLKPGQQPGTSDVSVRADRQADFSGRVGLSNQGSEFLRRERLSGNFTLYNPFGRADQLSLDAISSGELLNYFKLDYRQVVNDFGSEVGSAFSRLDYKLGESLSALDARGDASTLDIWLEQPVLLSYHNSLFATINYQHQQLDDRIGSTIQRDRDLSTVDVSLRGEHRGLLSNGYGYWRFGFTAGNVDFNNLSARQDDVATANTQGDFTRIRFDLGYLYDLSPDSRWWLSFSGQQAGDNLDSSQKMVLGGSHSVRAFDSGAASGDSGYLLRLEYQHILSRTEYGTFQGVVFADSGHVKVNQSPWISSDNGLTLQGAGLGMNWYGSNRWYGQLMIGSVVGGKPASVDGDTSRAWIEISRAF